MGRWSPSTPCDLALDGEDHPPHDYPHADQMFWCNGEGIEHTPIEGTGYMQWLDEVDWEKADWDKIVAAERARENPAVFIPEPSFRDRVDRWVLETPAAKFYSILAIAAAFGLFLIAVTYLMYRNF